MCLHVPAIATLLILKKRGGVEKKGNKLAVLSGKLSSLAEENFANLWIFLRFSHPHHKLFSIGFVVATGCLPMITHRYCLPEMRQFYGFDFQYVSLSLSSIVHRLPRWHSSFYLRQLLWTQISFLLWFAFFVFQTIFSSVRLSLAPYKHESF